MDCCHTLAALSRHILIFQCAKREYMQAFPFTTKSIFYLSVLLAATAIGALPATAQKPLEPEQKPGETTNVAVVEVTPDQATVAIGAKVQFKAVAKDASGKTLPDAVKFWYAAPFDAAGAEQNGEVSFFQPTEVTVGALIGGKFGYAHVVVSKPHIARIDVRAPGSAVFAGGSHLLTATPRNANGDPRIDIPLTWASENPAIATVDPAGLVHALKPGKTKIRATGDGVSGEASVEIAKAAFAKLVIAPETITAKTGDVLHFAAKGGKGETVAGEISWSVQGAGAQIWPDGSFVAERPGTYTVIAAAGDREASASVLASPRGVGRDVELVSRAMPKDDQFAEEWIWDHYAYLSSISDKLYIFDIADPAHPQSADPLKVDARIINDVSVTPDGKIGVITREGASNRKNGIVFLDTSDGLHPKVLSEYTATVTGGVHSAFVNSHYVYLTDDSTGSLRVIDFADPKNPKEVARWQVETTGQMQTALPEGEGVSTAGRYLHDVQVVDGLAYLAYWRDGVVILDVGNGIKGGSPEHPQFVCNYRFNYDELYGAGWLSGAHAVYRYKNYVFVGDEVFPAIFSLASRERIPVRGIAHVLDVSDITKPREVATYSVPEAGSHNIWVFDDVLYMGYYNGGARVLDVSGELRGELYSQGREIARYWSGDSKGYRTNLPFAWGAFPYKGLIYVNDVHSGLSAIKLGKPKAYSITTDPAR
jgi:hypothetical protein